MPIQPRPRADTSSVLLPSLRLRIAWLRDTTATDGGDPRRPQQIGGGMESSAKTTTGPFASPGSRLRAWLEGQLQHLAFARRSFPGTRLEVVNAGPEQPYRPP